MSLVAGFVAGVSFFAPAPMACSICRCGDPMFNALGIAGYTTSGLGTALDWERFDKDEGDAADETESQVENRTTMFLSYGFGQRFLLSIRVPYSVRELTVTAAGEEPETIHTHGFSDPEIVAQAMLWASPMSNLGRRSSVALSGGVKTPWGENKATSNGERLDEHAQPGTGSTDVFGNISLLYLIDLQSSLFASTGYRHTGENDYGYQYGSTFLANLSYEHKIGRYVDGVMELNFRYADKDVIDSDGKLGDDTGGSLLYITPKVFLNLTHGFILRLAAQIPTVAVLNGEQTEQVVLNIGVTYLFSH
jgi:hypothetical protein